MAGVARLAARSAAAFRTAAPLQWAAGQGVGRRWLDEVVEFWWRSASGRSKVRSLLGLGELLVAVFQLAPKSLIADFELLPLPCAAKPLDARSSLAWTAWSAVRSHNGTPTATGCTS